MGSLFLSSCSNENNKPLTCKNDDSLNVITYRNFKMGFSTWSFGPTQTDKDETYKFINLNSDITLNKLTIKFLGMLG